VGNRFTDLIFGKDVNFYGAVPVLFSGRLKKEKWTPLVWWITGWLGALWISSVDLYLGSPPSFSTFSAIMLLNMALFLLVMVRFYTFYISSFFSSFERRE
jgi:hypothetical protein